jgi:RNA-directed DNA polymerase
VRLAYDDAGTGGRKKRRLFYNGADTGIKKMTGHESGQTSDWSSSQESLENRKNGGKQMTVMAEPFTGAPTALSEWDSIDWKTAKAEVLRLQMRIAKAVREGRHNKVKSLQWLLTHSQNAKRLAVKRVTQNHGKKTPGVDNIIWKTAKQKIAAVRSLKRRGYNTLPLKRVYITKQDGRQRPLSIAVMKCRAMQALYLLALEPVAEMHVDQNSYGFRPKRSTADAAEQCFLALAKKGSAQWILEADIKSCFDNLSHGWLQNNIPMDKVMLHKWLTAGYIDQGMVHQTEKGTAQGSPISPVLLNMALSGLEDAVKSITSKRQDKVHVIVYADDFIITGSSKAILEETVKPLVKTFLKERGLELSREKSKITHIDEGFDFLGIQMRKYKGKLIRTPSKKSISRFLNEIKTLVKSNPTAKTENLLRQLNPKIRGWSQYFQHVCAKKTFGQVDSQIFKILWRWIKRRHPMKSGRWRKEKYFRSHGNRNWVFSVKIPARKGSVDYLDLFQASSVPIRRHIKIRAEATPYDPRFKEYFELRKQYHTRSPAK